MYISVKLLFLSIFIVNFCIFGDLFSFEPPNLKTVLFEDTDLNFHCWSSYEVALLLNRKVMQDLIPRKIPRDLPMVLKYLKHVEDLASKIPPSINQTLVMAAIGDVLGGYLQAIVIPMTNEAYYAGNVDYATASQLHTMLDKWKWYLSTDGLTWARDCDMHKIPTKVSVLDAGIQDPDSACQELYVSSSTPNQTDTFGTQNYIAEASRIAIPYFDNNVVPSAIALPFRKRNLYSLVDPKAAFILVKYYTTSVSCLSKNVNDIQVFHNYFHLWIVSKVVPHLHDEDQWYPALGAVMRVVETIKQKGLTATNPVYVQPLQDDHQDTALNGNLEVGDPSILKHSVFNSSFHILNSPYGLIILFVSVMVILLCFSCLICTCCIVQCGKKKKEKCGLCIDDNMLKNAVISLYCGLKDSISNLTPSKSDSQISQKTDFMPVAPNSPLQYDAESILSSVTTESDETSSLSSRDE